MSPRTVWQLAQAFETGTWGDAFGQGIEKIGNDVHETNPEQAKKDVQEKYGPAAYKKTIENYLDKSGFFTTEDTFGIRARLIADTHRGYEAVFNAKGGIMDSFREAVGELSAQRERAFGMIKNRAYLDRQKLREKIDASRSLDKTPIPDETVPQFSRSGVGPGKEGFKAWVDYVKYDESEINMRNAYREALGKLLKLYMTPELRDSKLGTKMQDGLIQWSDSRLHYLYAEGLASQDSLKAFGVELSDRLKKYAALDGRPGELGVKDVQILQHQAGRIVDAKELQLIANAGSAEKMVESLEARRLLFPDNWQDGLGGIADLLIDEIERNGVEQIFLDTMNEYQDATNQRIMSQYANPKKAPRHRRFRTHADAKAFFKNRLMETWGNGADVKDVLSVLDKVNEKANGGRMDSLSDTQEYPVFAAMVFQEREMLLRRVTLPEKDIDQAVVEFVSADRKGREKILKNPARRQALFRAIQAIENPDGGYVKLYEKSANRFNDRTTFTSYKGNPEKRLTGQDKAARTKALLTLAGEARWIVGNFDQTEDFKGQKLADALRGTAAEIHQPMLEFRHVEKLYDCRYQPIAAGMGFSGKGLAKTAGKIIGWGIIIANGMKAFEEHGWSVETLEGAAKKPPLLGALAMEYGLYRAEKGY
ncbi:MAG: hypothetical protein ABIG11_00800, partial [bacterium]